MKRSTINKANQNEEMGQQTAFGGDHFAWEVIKALGQGVTILGADGRFEYVNPAYAQMVGHPPEALIGLSPFDVTHPDDHEKLQQAREERFSGKHSSYETRLLKPDGTIVYAHITNTPRWEEGQIGGAYAIITDLTEHKQAAREHKAQQQFIQKILAANPNILYIFDLDLQQLIFLNEQAIATISLTEAEIQTKEGNFLTRLIHPEDLPSLIEHFARLQTAADDNILEAEYRMRYADGSWHWFYSRDTVFKRAGNGRVQQILGTATDITDRKQALTGLQESQAQLAGVLASAMDAIICLDEAQKIVLFNTAAEQMFGYNMADMLGQPLDCLLPQRFRSSHRQYIQHFGQIGKTNRKMGELGALLALRADGQEFPVEVSISQASAGGKTLFTAILRDITERKQAEALLLEREKRFRALTEHSQDGVLIFGANGRIEYASPFTSHMMGYTWEEISGADPVQFTHPDDLAGLLVKLSGLLQAPGETITTQYRMRHKDGSWRWLESNISNFFHEPAISGLVFNFRDITERKLANETLRQSEVRYRRLFENALVGIFRSTVDGRFLQVNPALMQMLGYESEGEMLALSLSTDVYMNPDQRTQLLEKLDSGGFVEGMELVWKRKDGGPIVVRAYSRRIQDDQENTYYEGFVQDISDYKQAEEALRQSEARYRAIVEDQTELIIRSRVDGTILFVNKAYSRAFGSAAEAMVGQNFFQFLGEKGREMVRSKFSRLTRENPMEVDEHETKLPDGRMIWLRWTHRGIFDGNGRLLEVQGIGYDITGRREAEEKLRQSETQLQHVIDTVPEGVLLLDTDGFVRLTNPVARQYLAVLAPGWEDGRFLTHLGSWPLSDLLTSPPSGLLHEINQENYIFGAIARPVESSSQTSGWVLVIHNMTQERDLQQRAQQQERLAAVGQLAAGIAHDFNNIMAVITLYAQLIARTVEMPVRAQERLGTIEQQAQRATDLIQQILDFSRQSVLERRPLDLLPFTKELVKLLNRTLPEHIKVDLAHTGEAYLIHADPSRIQQVMMNLAVNARDAMPDGGRLQISLAHLKTETDKHLFVHIMPPDDWIQIQVTDSGSGIPTDLLPRIFEPFFTTKEVGRGTGLGLAQVYGIVQQHEGYIDVATKEGEGTTFTLYFRTFMANERQRNALDNASLLLGQQQAVLLVEDNPPTRQALLDSLTLLNYEVIEATNGREALDILAIKASDIALVVSDVVMPEMGGIALLHAMRQLNLNIPVVLLTGHPLSREMENLQTLGLAGWLLKPPTLVNLSQLLAQILAEQESTG